MLPGMSFLSYHEKFSRHETCVVDFDYSIQMKIVEIQITG